MKLASIVTAVFLCSTGCAARSVTQATAQSVVPSHAANVLALVQEPKDEPATAVETKIDLADLDLQIPETAHDFALRDHAAKLSQRCVGQGVTTTCGAAPADDAQPKPIRPDTFSFPGPDHKAQTSK
jgi:hypothetical protein